MKKKKGFSLIELLLILTMLAMIISLSLPLLLTSNPNKSLVKKAFSVLRDRTDEIATEYTTLDGNYCNYFFAGVNTIPHAFNGVTQEANSCANTMDTHLNIVTTNGMYFYGMGQDFSSNPITITVDVNGVSGPEVENEDIFKFEVYSDGRSRPKSTKAKEYIFCKLRVWGNITDGNALRDVIQAVKGLSSDGANNVMANILNDPANYMPYTLFESISYKDAYTSVIDPLDVFDANPKAGINITYYNY